MEEMVNGSRSSVPPAPEPAFLPNRSESGRLVAPTPSPDSTILVDLNRPQCESILFIYSMLPENRLRSAPVPDLPREGKGSPRARTASPAPCTLRPFPSLPRPSILELYFFGGSKSASVARQRPSVPGVTEPTKRIVPLKGEGSVIKPPRRAN